MSDDGGSNVSTVAELALSAVYVSVIAPNMAPNWLKDGDFSKDQTNGTLSESKVFSMHWEI